MHVPGVGGHDRIRAQCAGAVLLRDQQGLRGCGPRAGVLLSSFLLQFCERVQLDSICSNELGDPDALARPTGSDHVSKLSGWQSIDKCALSHPPAPCRA